MKLILFFWLLLRLPLTEFAKDVFTAMRRSLLSSATSCIIHSLLSAPVASSDTAPYIWLATCRHTIATATSIFLPSRADSSGPQVLTFIPGRRIQTGKSHPLRQVLMLSCRAIRQIRPFHYFKLSNPPAECPPTNLFLATTRESTFQRVSFLKARWTAYADRINRRLEPFFFSIRLVFWIVKWVQSFRQIRIPHCHITHRTSFVFLRKTQDHSDNTEVRFVGSICAAPVSMTSPRPE